MSATFRRRGPRWPVSLTLMARRSWADLPLVALYAVIVLVTVAIAVAAPRLADRVSAAGLTDVLESNPERTQVVVGIDLDEFRYDFGRVNPSLARDVQTIAGALHSRLEPPLAAVLSEPVATVTTRSLSMPLDDGTVAALRLNYVWSAGQSGVTWIQGQAPGTAPLNPRRASSAPIEVAFSQEVARATGVRAGDELTLKQPDNSMYTLAVTGVFRANNPDDAVWAQTTGLTAPVTTPTNGVMRLTVGALLGEQSLPVARLQLPVHATVATYTFAVLPDQLGIDDLDVVSSAIGKLRSRPADLAPRSNIGAPTASTVAVSTDVDKVFSDYRATLRSAMSQASVIGAALALTSALALIVCGGLLAERRRAVLDLEIQRGASLVKVVARIGLEALIVTAVATVLGVMLAATWVPTGSGVSALVALEVAIAICAAVVATVAALGTGAGPRKMKANRADRKRAQAATRARRTVAELALVMLSIGALVAARGRGVAQSTTAGIDPLLVAAPVLVALAGTIVVVRLIPPVLAGLRRGASHARGAVAVVAAARAQSARFGGPAVSALTVALAMIIICGVLGTSVTRGQEAAALAQVGADVRVRADSASLAAAATEVGHMHGVDSVVLGRVDEQTQVRVANTVSRATVMVVTRDSDGGPVNDSATGAPQAFVTAGIAAPGVEVMEVFWGNHYIAVHVAGHIAPVDGVETPTVMLDADELARAAGAKVRWDTLWVNGEGADAAVAAATTLKGAHIDSRTAHLANLRAPLVSALAWLLDAGVVLFAVFGALVLVLWVISSSPERGRTLSALRTLGLKQRAATAISLAELVPTVVASLGAASVIGIGVPWVLGPALSLTSLSGGAPPHLNLATPAWWVAAGVAVGALVLTVTIETWLRMRARLGEVLRVGGQ